jgi:hypothetical protein
MPSLLTLSDVMGTGHHAALEGERAPRQIAAVVGDGAVGLCGVIAARRSAQSRSSCSAATPTALPWRAGSGRPMSSASVGTPRSSAYAS